MSGRDDMVITPHIRGRQEKGPKERAAEERHTSRAKARKRGLLKRIRRGRQIRQARLARLKGKGVAARAAGKGIGKVAAAKGSAKLASRFAGPIGVALLIMDVAEISGGLNRRILTGASGRRQDAEDANTVWGSIDETATAASRARANMAGSDPILYLMAETAGTSAQVAKLGAWHRKRELAIAVGRDIIERDEGFDTADSTVDKAIEGAKAELKRGADSFVDVIRGWMGKAPLTR